MNTCHQLIIQQFKPNQKTVLVGPHMQQADWAAECGQGEEKSLCCRDKTWQNLVKLSPFKNFSCALYVHTILGFQRKELLGLL